MTAPLVAAEPFVRWDWIFDHGEDIATQLLEHVQLTLIAVMVGMAISLPLAIWAYRRRVVYAPITWITGLLYTIPSLALFVLLVPITGLSTLTAEIGLVGYTLLILIRNTVAGLNAVPDDAKEAALGMGYGPPQLLWRVEVPLALPAIMAGVRIATVTTIGLVTVTALIGKGGLGYFILIGLQRFFPTAALLGAVLSIALAVAFDFLLFRLQRRLTPWATPRRGDLAREPAERPRAPGLAVT